MHFGLKLSAHENYAASWLVLAMLLSQLLIAFPMAVSRLRDPWAVDGIAVGVALLAAAAVGGALRGRPKLGRGVTAGAYAQSFLTLAALRGLQGAWLLATGRSWGRYRHMRLPRATA